MQYLKAVAIAIGLCSIALILVSILNVVVGVMRGAATGIAFVRSGVIEFAIASIVLGWLTGTAWYLIRR